MSGRAAARTRSAAGQGVLEIAGILVLALSVAFTIGRRWGDAWDFATFYHAATALGRGLDPYRLDTLSAVAGRSITLPFLYPPVTFALFLPFTWLSLPTATTVWLVLKLGLQAGLVHLWRMFLPGTRLLGLIAMAVFAFDASLLWDLKTGNVSVVEQFLLWLGFACYLEDRRRAFAALVVIASTFKLLPIAFLALLLVPSRTRHASRGLALAGLALFAAIVFAPSWLGPTWAHGYLSSLRIERPYGERNPSALGILDMALHGAPPPGSDRMDRALLGWGLWSGALVALSAPRLRRVWAERDPRQSVFVAAFLFALVAPRMMVYSYLLLVAPALALARDLFPRPAVRALALVPVVAQGIFQLLPAWWRAPVLMGLPRPAALVVANLSYFVALLLWLSWLWRGRHPRR